MIFPWFVDWKLMHMRIFSLIVHLITTCMLIWCKLDSVQVSMADVNNDEEYIVANRSYMFLVGFGIPFLLFELGYFMFNNPSTVTFSSAVHLCLDVAAIFMNSWIVLDGLDWHTYIGVWVCCVGLPFLYDIMCLCLQASNHLWIRRHTMGLFERLYHWWYGKRVELTE